MSEQQDNRPPESQPPKPKKPQIYTRGPNGEMVDIFDLMEQNRRNLETEMNVATLRSGDLLALRCKKGDDTTDEFTFDIKSAKWGGLGMGGGFSPSPDLVGKLDGPKLPDEVKGINAHFEGSGFGGSMMSPGLLATGRSPYFFFPGKGEFRLPYLDYFEVFRRDQAGNLQPLDPNQLDLEGKGKAIHHEARLSQADQLMKIFGFENFNIRGNQITDIQEYEDERYIAEYMAHGAMGNELAIFDKKMGQWMKFKYYAFNNEDFLQVAFADLSDINVRELFTAGKIIFDLGAHWSREGIVTFNSSGRLGMEAINYRVSDEQAKKVLNIPEWFSRTVNPDIQIWPDGRIEVPREYPMSEVEEKHPGTIEKIKNSVSAKTAVDGAVYINLNGKKINLKIPDEIVPPVIENNRSESQNTRSSLKNRAGKLIGRFIRREKS